MYQKNCIFGLEMLYFYLFSFGLLKISCMNEVFIALLSGYRDDVEKYASKPKEQDAIRYILNYGWTFAAHRIQFSKFTSSSFKATKAGNAFRILEKTLLLELVFLKLQHHSLFYPT